MMRLASRLSNRVCVTAAAGVALATSSMQSHSQSLATQQDDTSDILEWLYADLPDIHEVPLKDVDMIDASGGNQAYGELTIRGVREIAALLRPRADDVFVDMGSGAGRCVLQAALEWPCRLSVGVELSESRHNVAAMALARAEPKTQRRALVLQDDLLTCTGIEDATIVYVASLLFDDEFMAQLGERLSSLPRIRAIATLTRIPPESLGEHFVEDPRNAARSDDQQTLRERVEVTWGAARVFLYWREERCHMDEVGGNRTSHL